MSKPMSAEARALRLVDGFLADWYKLPEGSKGQTVALRFRENTRKEIRQAEQAAREKMLQEAAEAADGAKLPKDWPGNLRQPDTFDNGFTTGKVMAAAAVRALDKP